jgi:CRISPR/Cas system-associated exonuclease Cas4 (RecB family)
MSDKIIRASEIGEYLYCNRSWWLRRVQGRTSQNVRELTAGTAHHEAHGRMVQRANITQKLALLFLFAAVLAFAYWYMTG